MLQPPAILLEGTPGSGKTFSLPTLAAGGLKTFVVMTEPDGTSSLIDGAKHHGVPLDNIHWTTVSPTPAGWSAIGDMVNKISMQSYEDITKIKHGIGKDETRKTACALLQAFQNFKCERTGEEFGDYTTWGDDRCLVVDSLSGLSLIAMALTIGFKPAAHQGEWGVAMNFLEQLLLKLTGDRKCFLVITAHIERETDELSGSSRIMVSTLGRKLAPKIPRFFSEVVLASRTLDKGFTWSTQENNADLKNRALPVSNNIKPDFRQVIESYKARLKAASVLPAAPSKVA